MQYRVLQNGDGFYPQYKWLFWFYYRGSGEIIEHRFDDGAAKLAIQLLEMCKE